MQDQLFLTASRRQLRFATTRGPVTVEDLWNLSLKSLDALAVSIDEQVKPGGRKTFLENPDTKAREADADNKLRLDILTTIIGIKQEDNKAALAEASTRRQKEFLKDLLGRKKIGEMEAMTVEQIEAQLAALG
jgi:hypothetical protein